jgi:uncharacterized protein (TIGR00251 family)
LEPATKGKANKAVIKALKPHLGACEIVSGHKSKKKRIHAQNPRICDFEAVVGCLVDF